ncbi:MAG TPA: transposase family protein [Nitrososphaeraceae archaeon]|nr:transposase family protein [Nitrososphaeraceae archaeon]
MLNYDRLSKKPLLFRSFTGLELSEFDSICQEVESKYLKYEIKRLSKRKERTRSIGAGRHFKHPIRDRFLMLLVYYKLYITNSLSGFLFDLDQSNVHRDIRYMEPIVKSCIPLPQKLYNITRRLRTVQEVEEYFPGFKAFIDATEQEIPRPKDNKKGKEYYSGKKKRHTVKTQYMVNKKGEILHKSKHKKGKNHDYTVYKDERPVTPKSVKNYYDLGYQGVEKDFPNMKVVLPIKKKHNIELTQKDKTYNKRHRRQRVIVEHTICRIKKFGIMGNKYRNRLKRYDVMSDIVSGLVNYRITTRR